MALSDITGPIKSPRLLRDLVECVQINATAHAFAHTSERAYLSIQGEQLPHHGTHSPCSCTQSSHSRRSPGRWRPCAPLAACRLPCWESGEGNRSPAGSDAKRRGVGEKRKKREHKTIVCLQFSHQRELVATLFLRLAQFFVSGSTASEKP